MLDLHSGASRKFLAGFTLLELLIVMGIIVILTGVLVAVITPTELLRQARDTQRLSDLDTLNRAIGLYLTDAAGGGALGSASTVYVSIPDPTATSSVGTNCSGLGFPVGPYHCAAPSTARKTDGTGWIPINLQSISLGSPLSVLPLDPINATSTGVYYTYTTDGSSNYKLTAMLESSKYGSLANGMPYTVGNNLQLASYAFPSFWVKVPGNAAFGTASFWVMKYDAKCISATTTLSYGTPGAAYDTGYRTYNDSGYPCTGANGRYIASAPDGFPIANVSHTTAVSYCQSLGAHLLTNDEYMTIVTNTANVSSNWSGGSPGSGYVYSGHNDNAPANALVASSDDAQGYYGETNIGGNQRRTLGLSNGATVWDFAGNVWQHVQRSVNNVGDLTTTMALPACSNGTLGWEWCEYASPGSPYISAWSSDVAQSKVGPSNSSWYSSQGMGQVYTYGTGANQGTTVFLRGGGWDSGSGAGPFTLSLAWGTGSTNGSVGFRCAR